MFIKIFYRRTIVQFSNGDWFVVVTEDRGCACAEIETLACMGTFGLMFIENMGMLFCPLVEDNQTKVDGS